MYTISVINITQMEIFYWLQEEIWRGGQRETRTRCTKPSSAMTILSSDKIKIVKWTSENYNKFFFPYFGKTGGSKQLWSQTSADMNKRTNDLPFHSSLISGQTSESKQRTSLRLLSSNWAHSCAQKSFATDETDCKARERTAAAAAVPQRMRARLRKRMRARKRTRPLPATAALRLGSIRCWFRLLGQRWRSSCCLGSRLPAAGPAAPLWNWNRKRKRLVLISLPQPNLVSFL